MTRENKRRAIELASQHRCTIETYPTVNGVCKEDIIAITDCCYNVIKDLFEKGFLITIKEGKLIVDMI